MLRYEPPVFCVRPDIGRDWSSESRPGWLSISAYQSLRIYSFSLLLFVLALFLFALQQFVQYHFVDLNLRCWDPIFLENHPTLSRFNHVSFPPSLVTSLTNALDHACTRVTSREARTSISSEIRSFSGYLNDWWICILSSVYFRMRKSPMTSNSS